MPIEDIFGEAGSGVFGFGARRQALLDTFNNGVRKQDKTFLEDAVVRYKKDVEQISVTVLDKAYTKACLYVGRLDLAYETLSRSRRLDTGQKEALAIVAFSMGNYEHALAHLQSLEPKTIEGQVVRSSSLYQKGEKDPTVHARLLKSVTASSALANNFIGALYYNQGEMNNAQRYLSKAAELAPDNEKIRLAEMTCQYARGNQAEVYSAMSKFYAETGSTLSVGDIQKELERSKLLIPRLKISSDLLNVVDQLL